MSTQRTLLRSALVVHRFLVRWAFARFYREFAWTYDTVAWLVSRGLWHRWTLASLPFLHGQVLEIGCGTGYVQQALARSHPALAVGLDASPQMLQLTRQRLQHDGATPRLVRSIAQNLPFPTGSFDTVLATFPAEYIIHPQTAQELRRVLRPAGRLVIVDAAQFTSDGVYERLTDAAYQLTLQASVREPVRYRPLDSLTAAGFSFTTHVVTVGPSQVLVMVGRAV
jgi:ubiquinone/menaquinone biosynthesis C-methylase UbiE